jgi:RNA polymerase sigma-70 factor (ECF subfamily)
MLDFEQEIDAAFGNAEAFAGIKECFDHNHGRLYQVAFQILSDSELSLDCVQDCFLKVLANPRAFRGDSNLATFLHRAVVNRSLDILRSGKFKMSSSRGLDSSDPQNERAWTAHDVVPRGYPSPLQTLLTKEKILGTNQMLRGMPAAQSSALLASVQGCTTREIAEREGVPMGTVLSRVSAARTALRN